MDILEKSYVTLTRVRVSDIGTDPSVGYVIQKNLGHGDTVLTLDSGTDTAIIFPKKIYI